MRKIASIEINLTAIREAGCAGPLLSNTAISRYIEDPSLIDDQLRKSLDDSGVCTLVYHACGTCEDGGALVEYYCNSSGGSQPDFTACEPCG